MTRQRQGNIYQVSSFTQEKKIENTEVVTFGHIDLKEHRKRFRKMDKDDEYFSSATKVMHARTEFKRDKIEEVKWGKLNDTMKRRLNLKIVKRRR